MKSSAVMLIVNEKAGGGRCGRRAPGAVAALREAGFDCSVRSTEYPGHATELARQADAEGIRRFVAVGGDGTAFEIVNGLFPRNHREDPVELGFLPLGTGNSFIRDFGVESESAAVERLLHGTGSQIDVVRLQHDAGELHFINILSIGFSAAVGEARNRQFPRLGKTGYAVAVMQCLLHLHAVDHQLVLDSAPAERFDYLLLSFCNSQFTGGTMRMAPCANVSDGYVDIVHVESFGRGRFLAAFPRIYRGSHLSHPHVRAHKAQQVEFVDRRREDVMIDGEIKTLELHSLEVVPRALRVMA